VHGAHVLQIRKALVASSLAFLAVVTDSLSSTNYNRTRHSLRRQFAVANHDGFRINDSVPSEQSGIQQAGV